MCKAKNKTDQRLEGKTVEILSTDWSRRFCVVEGMKRGVVSPSSMGMGLIWQSDKLVVK